jgi:hypothetical protein
MEYSFAHCCRINPRVLRSRPPSPPPPPSSPPCYEELSSSLSDLPLPYESLSDVPPSFHWLVANGKMFALESGGEDAKMTSG